MTIRMRHPTLKRGWVTSYYEGRIKIIDGEIEVKNPKSVYILSRSGWKVVMEDEPISLPTTVESFSISATPPPETPQFATTAAIESIEVPSLSWKRTELNEYARKLRISRPERFRRKRDLLDAILEKLKIR